MGLGNRTHIGFEEFKNINWLPSKERFEQCVSVGIYKLCNNLSPAYMTDIYTKTDTRYALRKGVHKLIKPFRSLEIGQKALSYVGPKVWNQLSCDLKLSKSANSFKHKIKESFF